MGDKKQEIEHIHTCLRAVLRDHPNTKEQKRLTESIMKQVKRLQNMDK